MKVFSLFSGIGGFDLAAQRLGHETIGACEINQYARTIYSRHFPEVKIYEDATKIKPEELPDFDILVAGFPCQTFSIAGKRLGFEESRGTLFFEIARIAREKRPRLLLLENVKGLLSHDRGKTFAVILSTLDELGYDAEWQVLNSKYFVPQNRERIFIIGHLRGERRREIFPIGEINKINIRTSEKTQEQGQRIRNQITGAIDANYAKGGGSRTMIYMSQKNANMKQRIQNRDETWCLTNNKNDFGIIEPKIKYFNNSESQAYRIYEVDGIGPTLGIGHAMNTPNIVVEPKIKSLGNIPIPFQRRKTEPKQPDICNYLKENKTTSIIELSKQTKITKTQLEHYFRSDSSGALPDREDWLKLKDVMKFDDTYDKTMTEYVEDYMTHEMATRVHDSSGLAPTLTGGEKLIAISSSGRSWGRESRIKTGEANTLTTGKGCNHQSTANYVTGDSRIRRLTPIECERLQGFPDNYTEGISDTQRYKCLGNAVTVPVVEYILKSMQKLTHEQ